eukprot:351559_1
MYDRSTTDALRLLYLSIQFIVQENGFLYIRMVRASIVTGKMGEARKQKRNRVEAEAAVGSEAVEDQKDDNVLKAESLEKLKPIGMRDWQWQQSKYSVCLGGCQHKVREAAMAESFDRDDDGDELDMGDDG